jgi:DNA-binding XRE family transcriptional regulator
MKMTSTIVSGPGGGGTAGCPPVSTPSPTRAALGHALRVLRRERGLSQEDLAHAAGISVQYLSGIERGRRNPTWVVLSGIAAALELRLSELVERAEAEA